MGPVAMLRQPLGSASQTQPNGPRAPYPVFRSARPAGHRPSRPSVVGHRHRAGLGAPVRVLRVQEPRP